MAEELTHKTFSQSPNPELLYNYLANNFPGGVYHSIYETGFCGHWIHNKLKSLEINSIVVNPADISTTDKEKVQKEDARDSRKIARLRKKTLKWKEMKKTKKPRFNILIQLLSSLMRQS